MALWVVGWNLHGGVMASTVARKHEQQAGAPIPVKSGKWYPWGGGDDKDRERHYAMWFYIMSYTVDFLKSNGFDPAEPPAVRVRT